MIRSVFVSLLLVVAPLNATTVHADDMPQKENAAISVTVVGAANDQGVVHPTGATLIKVIALSGGWTKNADLRKVAIIRKTTDGKTEKIVVNVQAILDGQAPDPSIEDKDIVHIPERIL